MAQKLHVLARLLIKKLILTRPHSGAPGIHALPPVPSVARDDRELARRRVAAELVPLVANRVGVETPLQELRGFIGSCRKVLLRAPPVTVVGRSERWQGCKRA